MNYLVLLSLPQLAKGAYQKKKKRRETFRFSNIFKMADAVAALELRASNAEKALADLKAKSTASSNEAVASRLKELLSLLEEDRKEAEEVRAHRDELKAENEKLRNQVGKLSYRVNHLLKTIAELEGEK